MYACFPLSHLPFLHLLERLENIYYHSNDPDSDIVIVDFGMQVHFPPVTSLCSFLHRAKLLYPPDEQLTSLARSSRYAIREAIKNTSHQKLVHTFDRFHTHTWTKHKFIVISLHSHHHLRSPLRLSFVPEHHSLVQQNATPKSNFGVHTGTCFQALHPMSRHLRFTPSSHRSGGFTRSLVYPYHPIHPMSISPPSSDKTGVPERHQLLYCYCGPLEHAK